MSAGDPLLDKSTREAGPREGAAIALSGGGYRAMLFHLGALWRMGQLGFFRRDALRRLDEVGTEQVVGSLERVSSVSGGSITAGVLALAWPDLVSADAFMEEAIQDLVVGPVRRMAAVNLVGRNRRGALFLAKAVASPGSVNDHIAEAYDKVLFRGRTLQDLPDTVRFVFNASNLQSGSVWRFSKPYMRDWRIGKVDSPVTPLAEVVAASSAFPPFLAPAMLNLRGQKLAACGGEVPGLNGPAYIERPMLADGGVYDNLGLESCYKQYRTLFVSNAGKPFSAEPRIRRNWVSLGSRCIDVLDNQVLSLRKRILVDALKEKRRFGAFWDIEQDISCHTVHALSCPPSATVRLAAVPTDLSTKDPVTQEKLINWGYALADAAISSWFKPSKFQGAKFPYPETGV